MPTQEKTSPVLDIDAMRKQAKLLKRNSQLTHTQCLDAVAQQHGYNNWALLHKHWQQQEVITGVAIRYQGVVHSLPRPNRHHNVIRMIASQNGVGIKGPDVQGFVTNYGRFLNRQEAYKLAVANKQIARREGAQFYQGTDLYSEDLW